MSHRKRSAFCCAMGLVLMGWPANSPAADPKSVAEIPPLGVPDYTQITGFIPKLKLPMEQPVVLWKAVTEEEKKPGEFETVGLTDPVIAGDVMYFGSDTGHLTAFHIPDQLILWTHEHGHRIAVKPSVNKDYVFFGSNVGITAVQRENGALAWKYAIPEGAGEATPLPVGRHLFASAYDGQSYCFDGETGVVRWEHDFLEDAPPDPSPEFAGEKARLGDKPARPNGSASDGKLFIQSVFDQSRVIALDCETGERRWTFQAQGWISPASVIADGNVFVASQDKHLYCLNLSDGTVQWKYAAPTWLASPAAAHQGKVYLPVHRAQLHELDQKTGRLVRVLEPPDAADRKGAVYSFPLITEETIYFAVGSSGLLLAFDRESGVLRWKLQPSPGSELFSSPATDGRHLFVSSRPGIEKNAGENAVLVIGAEEAAGASGRK